MNNLNSTESEHLCKELSGAFKGVLSWKWDDRFQTVLAEFDVDNKTHIHDVLENRLGKIWNTTNIEKAPVVVQTIINGFGGLMPGQLLFTSNPGLEGLVFCAWWPWGNGKTISIRLAPFYHSGKTQEARQLKEWFGINPDA